MAAVPSTYCMWLKPDSLSGGRVFWYRGSTSTSGYVLMAANADGSITVEVGSGAQWAAAPAGTLVVGQWTFVALSIGASNAFRIGHRAEGVGTLTTATTTLTAGTNTQHMALGNGPTIPDANNYDGSAAFYRCFETALDAAGMMTESQSATAVATEYADWPLTDAASVTTDASGNSRPLTATGTATTTDSDVPVLTAGGPVALTTGTTGPVHSAAAAYLAVGTVVTKSIAAGSDDASEEIANGNVVVTNANQLMNVGGLNMFRFTGINIPKGADIELAQLHFFNWDLKYPIPNQRIWAEAADNAATGVAGTGTATITSRAKTTAMVNWVDTQSLVDDTWRSTFDLKALVQEVVDRAGWASGNAINFLTQGNSSGLDSLTTLTFEDAGVGTEPRLTIVWRYDAIELGAQPAGAVATCRATRTRVVDPLELTGYQLMTHDAVSGSPNPLTPTVVPDTPAAGDVRWGLTTPGGSTAKPVGSNHRHLRWIPGVTFKDGRIRVLYEPWPGVGNALGDGDVYVPQMGVMLRGNYTDISGKFNYIMCWYDVAFTLPGIHHFASTNVVLSPDHTLPPMRGTASHAGVTPPGIGSSFSVPYWVEIEIVGEKLNYRCWPKGGSPPVWDRANADQVSLDRDFSAAATPGSGDNVYANTPTPAQGFIGLFLGHMGTPPKPSYAGTTEPIEIDFFGVMGLNVGLAPAAAGAVASTSQPTASVVKRLTTASSGAVGHAAAASMRVSRALSPTTAGAVSSGSAPLLRRSLNVNGGLGGATQTAASAALARSFNVGVQAAGVCAETSAASFARSYAFGAAGAGAVVNTAAANLSVEGGEEADLAGTGEVVAGTSSPMLLAARPLILSAAGSVVSTASPGLGRGYPLGAGAAGIVMGTSAPALDGGSDEALAGVAGIVHNASAPTLETSNGLGGTAPAVATGAAAALLLGRSLGASGAASVAGSAPAGLRRQMAVAGATGVVAELRGSMASIAPGVPMSIERATLGQVVRGVSLDTTSEVMA